MNSDIELTATYDGAILESFWYRGNTLLFQYLYSGNQVIYQQTWDPRISLQRVPGENLEVLYINNSNIQDTGTYTASVWFSGASAPTAVSASVTVEGKWDTISSSYILLDDDTKYDLVLDQQFSFSISIFTSRTIRTYLCYTLYS